MKRKNGWWIDENNNKWTVHCYTKDEAEYLSKSLINCSNCVNCNNCNNCNGCWNCDYCNDCWHCDNCGDCYGCVSCTNCVKCITCFNCNNCHAYIINPSRYITQNIGSRKAQTHFYYGKTKDGMSLQVKCGCFKGNLKEFAEAVEKTHGGNEYGEQYRREIEKVKMLFDLED